MNDTIKKIYEIVLSGYRIKNVENKSTGMWKDHIKLYAWREAPDTTILKSRYGYLDFVFYLHPDPDKCTFLFSK